jgi:hypothetical protein
MWLFENREITSDIIDDYIGFVYCITNNVTGKKYIGKKLFKNTRRTKVKGQTRRKKTVKESDWKEYWGSNKVLQEDVNTLGEDNFERIILKLCKTKGECNYWEAKYQMQYEVLESDDWYNEWIMVKVHRSHINKE